MGNERQNDIRLRVFEYIQYIPICIINNGKVPFDIDISNFLFEA